MKVIFGTTSKRKIKDLEGICSTLGIDIEILGLTDIDWDLDEIEENGTTLEENSLIKAQLIHGFCLDHGIYCPIITDDAGLFCDALDGEPGIYTARYGDDEMIRDSRLPDYHGVTKLLRKMKDNDNRSATYRCCVTCMMPDGSYFQEFGESHGNIIEGMPVPEDLKKPYFFSVFVLDGTSCPFSDLEREDLTNTYRYQALGKTLKKIK